VSGVDDLLWRHLRDLPAFRALLRAVEAHFYTDLPLARPVLDLGCGDGHFASVAFERPLEAGFDPWWGPLAEARKRQAYHLLTQAEGAQMPYPDGAFATVVSNSVLEHIPRVQPVLAEVARVLRSPEPFVPGPKDQGPAKGRPGGVFYFCVPGPNFLPFLSIGRALDRLWPLCNTQPAVSPSNPVTQSPSNPIRYTPGNAYRRFFNRISRHYHCDGADVWERRLEAAGLQLVRWWSYFSPRALVALEWGHYLGLPSLVCKKLTGRWVLCPSRANLWLTERLVRRYYEEPLPPQGAYLFLVAHKPEV